MGEHFRVYSAVFPIIIKRYEGQMQVLLSRRKNTGYMDGRWDFAGEPYIAEPEKCSGLQWFAIDRLPDEIIGIRKRALKLYLEAVPYDEVVTGNKEGRPVFGRKGK